MIFVRNKKEKTSKRAAAPRPKVRPWWRETWFVGGTVALVIMSISGGAWWMTSTGIVAAAVQKTEQWAIGVTAGMGLRVQEVMVSGRVQTPREDLLNTIGLSRGSPILAFDIAKAKERVDALPWVRTSTVERMLPDTVLVSIIEREPLALWQKEKTLHLVDAEGVVILSDDVGAYSDLLIVVGDGAEIRAAELIALLGTEPELMNHVRAATWVGGRRWNVHLHGDIDVRLPEDDAGEAWTRLAEYHKSHRVLEKNVTVLDLRIPDRLIVKTRPTESGQET